MAQFQINGQKYSLSNVSANRHPEFLFDRIFLHVCVSQQYRESDYKHTNSGGSPVIHRLEDNRQMMNDEDEWHSTPAERRSEQMNSKGAPHHFNELSPRYVSA